MKFKPELRAYCMPGMPRRSVEEACQAMVRNFPEVITIPQPTLSQRMWTEKTPCLKIDREKRQLYFELSGHEDELVEFYDRYLSVDLDYFAISPDLDPTLYFLAEMYKEKPWSGLKLIHFSFPGLYSWGLSIKDEHGAPALYDETLRDVLIKSLAVKAKWREKKVKELFPGIQIMVTVGDGALSVYGSAGGTGTWDRVKKDYNEIMELLDSITCIHCCANFDWSLLMETSTDSINFDAYQYGNTMSLYADQLKRFLGRGGMIAWGIVPTAGSGGDITVETPDNLANRLEDAIQMVVDKGIDRELLLEASWITATCETNTMPVALSDRVHEATREVSQIMRARYFG